MLLPEQKYLFHSLILTPPHFFSQTHKKDFFSGDSFFMFFLEPIGPLVGGDHSGEYQCPGGPDHTGAIGPKFNVKRHMRKCKILKAAREAADVPNDLQAECGAWKAKAEALQNMNDELLKAKEELENEFYSLKYDYERLGGNEYMPGCLAPPPKVTHPYGKEPWDCLPSFEKVQSLLAPAEESLGKLLRLKLEREDTRNIRTRHGVIEVFESTDQGPVWKKKSTNFLETLARDLFKQLFHLYAAAHSPSWINSQYNGGDAQNPRIGYVSSQLDEQSRKLKKTLLEMEPEEEESADAMEEAPEDDLMEEEENDEALETAHNEETIESTEPLYNCKKCGGKKCAPNAKCGKPCQVPQE